MTPEQFCYWLQGRAELDPNPPSFEQWQSIREHLQTVFTKVTPLVQRKEGPDHQISPMTPSVWPFQPNTAAAPNPLRAECVC